MKNFYVIVGMMVAVGMIVAIITVTTGLLGMIFFDEKGTIGYLNSRLSYESRRFTFNDIGCAFDRWWSKE